MDGVEIGTCLSRLMAASQGTPLEGEPVRRLFESTLEHAHACGLTLHDTQPIFTTICQFMSRESFATSARLRQLSDDLLFEHVNARMGR
jgi:hypothetical protein